MNRFLREALILEGWSRQEIERFIEKFPMIWIQAIQFFSLIDAVNHVSIFAAYKELDELEIINANEY